MQGYLGRIDLGAEGDFGSDFPVDSGGEDVESVRPDRHWCPAVPPVVGEDGWDGQEGAGLGDSAGLWEGGPGWPGLSAENASPRVVRHLGLLDWGHRVVCLLVPCVG